MLSGKPLAAVEPMSTCAEQRQHADPGRNSQGDRWQKLPLTRAIETTR
jgi:hypothetical protein